MQPGLVFFVFIRKSNKISFGFLFNRAFLAVDVVLWFIRLLILLMIDRTVGPMLLMIQAMVGVVCVCYDLI
jgi:hypothetical protein